MRKISDRRPSDEGYLTSLLLKWGPLPPNDVDRIVQRVKERERERGGREGGRKVCSA